MNMKTFKRGIAALMQAFPNRTFDNDIMFDFLQDLTDEEFLQGIQKVISSTRELYPGTNIIALIRENAKTQRRITAGEAWAIVRNKISAIGSYGHPEFENPLITKAVEAIGWRDMCLSENIMIERAHFLKIYDTLCLREKEEQTYLPSPAIKNLIGEQENLKEVKK